MCVLWRYFAGSDILFKFDLHPKTFFFMVWLLNVNVYLFTKDRQVIVQLFYWCDTLEIKVGPYASTADRYLSIVRRCFWQNYNRPSHAYLIYLTIISQENMSLEIRNLFGKHGYLVLVNMYWYAWIWNNMKWNWAQTTETIISDNEEKLLRIYNTR